MARHDVVMTGGRVVDPESGLDGQRNVGISGSTVAAVTEAPLDGTTVIDVSGLVVAPGFIDLHSHAQTLAGRRLQAHDGVTTALDLEAGRSPVEKAYDREALLGSPIHYGFSASWGSARMRALTGVVADGGVESALSILGNADWRVPCTPKQLSQTLALLADDLARGAIGVGLLLGYAPDVDPVEFLEVAKLAGEFGVPTFTHCRDLVEILPTTKIDGAEEIVPRRGRDRRHHALLPHQQHVGTPHRPRARPNRAQPTGRQPRDHGGISVRFGSYGDRSGLPRT